MVRKSPAESATKFSIGTRKKGLDGNTWKIVQTKSGVRRWQKVSTPTKTRTRKRTRKRTRRKIRKRTTSKRKRRSRKRSRKRRTRKRRSRRKTRSQTRKRKSSRKTGISKKICGKSVPKGKKYLVHDNGGRPFMVAKESKSSVGIYKKCKEYYKLPDEENSRYYFGNIFKLYTDLIKEYSNVKKLFTGRDYSEYNAHGNTILLELPNDRYVFIGDSVYEFTTPEKNYKLLFIFRK